MSDTKTEEAKVSLLARELRALKAENKKLKEAIGMVKLDNRRKDLELLHKMEKAMKCVICFDSLNKVCQHIDKGTLDCFFATD